MISNSGQRLESAITWRGMARLLEASGETIIWLWSGIFSLGCWEINLLTLLQDILTALGSMPGHQEIEQQHDLSQHYDEFIVNNYNAFVFMGTIVRSCRSSLVLPMNMARLCTHSVLGIWFVHVLQSDGGQLGNSQKSHHGWHEDLLKKCQPTFTTVLCEQYIEMLSWTLMAIPRVCWVVLGSTTYLTRFRFHRWILNSPGTCSRTHQRENEL